MDESVFEEKEECPSGHFVGRIISLCWCACYSTEKSVGPWTMGKMVNWITMNTKGRQRIRDASGRKKELKEEKEMKRRWREGSTVSTRQEDTKSSIDELQMVFCVNAIDCVVCLFSACYGVQLLQMFECMWADEWAPEEDEDKEARKCRGLCAVAITNDDGWNDSCDDRGKEEPVRGESFLSASLFLSCGKSAICTNRELAQVSRTCCT